MYFYLKYPPKVEYKGVNENGKVSNENISNEIEYNIISNEYEENLK